MRVLVVFSRFTDNQIRLSVIHTGKSCGEYGLNIRD
jgi:hypothetical protein